nr:putative RdRp [Rhodnius prolixus virus 5]
MSRFDEALSQVDKTSSTGCSYLRMYGPTIGDALLWNGYAYDSGRVAFLKNVIEVRVTNLINGIDDFDPIKVFIKQEPHKLKKRDKELWRLISSVSPVDTLIDRMLFGPYMDEVVENFQRYPCKIGWTPTCGGYRYLRRLFKRRTMSLDKSGWDWTVPAWLIDEWLRFLLWTLPESNTFAREMFKIRFRLLFEKAILELGRGFVLQQNFKGFMKSGCFLTIFLNSLGQSMMHYAAMKMLKKKPLHHSPISVGDDTLQEFFDYYEAYRECLRKLGCIPKPAEISEVIEFAGFYVTSDDFSPAYKNKHLYNLKYMDENVAVEAIQSLMTLYPFDAEFYARLTYLLSVRDASLIRPRVQVQLWASGILDSPFGLSHDA